ncbi:MAG TPA: tRNA pseudouridine(55) synthase TruB [Polyangia bacterium]|nr:tRNA pseudouridine(55) synthase TruB [Polyangia bacterium]
MNGVVVVDKPGGMTSFDVVARVRRVFGERRVGHTGTLDPMATGVLPVCLGEATKLVPFLMSGDKAYEAELRLGVTTDSADATGTVTSETSAAQVSRADVERAIPGFVGTIQQTPPMHSAVRVGGKRLYEFARAGVEVERAARPVVVHAIELLAFESPTVRILVRCGKGTYIRALAADLGAVLGVGAHLTALRRTQVGPFAIAQAVTLEALAATTPLLSPAEALADHATVPLDEAQTRDVRAGKLRAIAELRAPDGAGSHVRLLDARGTLVAVAEQHAGRLTLARVFC